jgi:hypothetical protein
MHINFTKAALLIILSVSLLSPGRLSIAPSSLLQETTDSSFYLPVIMKGYPGPPIIFGAETESLNSWRLDIAGTADLNWLRSTIVSWADIEPVRTDPPTYHWETMDEAGLAAAAEAGFTPIMVVKYTPAWAQKIPGVKCGPIASEALDEFQQFVLAAVQRYSINPYRVQYWEFGNEPDVDPSMVSPNSPFGCWGDNNDRYYGGGYYAEMLKWAYPAMKQASPYSKLIIGGLLLDCDPEDPPPGNTSGCKPSKFLEGILRNQGADFFDIVAFHTYATYYDNHIMDEDYYSWESRGGQIYGKIDFLQSIMSTYGVNKPILMSEVSLLCSGVDCTTPSPHFLDLQADFVVSANVRSWGLGLLGSVWYMLEESSWRQSGLFIGATPKPGYHALVFMTDELKDAVAGPAITQYEGLRGYEFTLPAKRVWVLWAPDGVNGKQITLPPGVTAIYDKFGNSITPIDTPLWVVHPTYIEFSP